MAFSLSLIVISGILFHQLFARMQLPALESGLIGAGIILAGLLARSLGVILALNKTPFSLREKGFCVLSYWPKATVQAAIGAIPLSLGAPHGELILAIAVLSIIITAPMGAIAIKLTGDKVLT